MKTEIVKTTCDRCGKEIPDWFDKSFRFYKRKFSITRCPFIAEKEMDLCKNCYESLRNWYYRKDEREEKANEKKAKSKEVQTKS